VCKIDKEIMALLHNIPPAVAGTYISRRSSLLTRVLLTTSWFSPSVVSAKGPEHVPPEIHTRLLTLLKQRQDELKPVIIRLS
jgi:hypothetical protein